jgi:hypothetical protein
MINVNVKFVIKIFANPTTVETKIFFIQDVYF